MSMENLSLRPNAVWKGLKAAAATPQQAEETRKRVEEQGIVKWEEDGATKRCRICQYVLLTFLQSLFAQAGTLSDRIQSII